MRHALVLNEGLDVLLAVAELQFWKEGVVQKF